MLDALDFAFGTSTRKGSFTLDLSRRSETETIAGMKPLTTILLILMLGCSTSKIAEKIEPNPAKPETSSEFRVSIQCRQIDHEERRVTCRIETVHTSEKRSGHDVLTFPDCRVKKGEAAVVSLYSDEPLRTGKPLPFDSGSLPSPKDGLELKVALSEGIAPRLTYKVRQVQAGIEIVLASGDILLPVLD